jgi:predicted  nucleic acid-binding Zn-ribbon protein
VTDIQLLKTYEAIRARKNNGGIGIGKVVENACSGCRMPVTSVDASHARAGEEVTYCQSCGRLLA